jgi:hypothetical protein
MHDRFEETAKAVLALAEIFDEARTKVKVLVPAGRGRDLVLETLWKAQQRAYRAYHAGEQD